MTVLLYALVITPTGGAIALFARPARDYLATCRRPEHEDHP